MSQWVRLTIFASTRNFDEYGKMWVCVMIGTNIRLKTFDNMTNIKQGTTWVSHECLQMKEGSTAFQISISNRFKPLQDQLENNDSIIDTMASMKCCKTHVRKSSAKKGSTQKWATVNTLKKMDVRKANNEALNTHQIRTTRGSHNYR